MTDRVVTVVYCDDIRNELGNKRSFMGVYQAILFLDKFPAALPKFCASIKVSTPVERPFTKLIVKLLRDDAEFASLPVPDEQLASVASTAPQTISGLSELRCEFNVDLILAPFQIDKPTILRVRVDTETEELKGTALRIEHAIPASTPNLVSSIPTSPVH